MAEDAGKDELESGVEPYVAALKAMSAGSHLSQQGCLYAVQDFFLNQETKKGEACHQRRPQET